VVGLVNEAGQLIEQYSYDAHGTLQVRACASTEVCEGAGPCALTTTCGAAVKPAAGEHAGTHGNTLLYAGTHRDPVTGHYRMGARWYDPTLRTFLSRDPAGYAFSFDEWAYTVGDPWNFVDRTGWMACPVINAGANECGPPEPGVTNTWETMEDFARGLATVGALALGTGVVIGGFTYKVVAEGLIFVGSVGGAVRLLAWDAIGSLVTPDVQPAVDGEGLGVEPGESGDDSDPIVTDPHVSSQDEESAEDTTLICDASKECVVGPIPRYLPTTKPVGSPQAVGREYERQVRELLGILERNGYIINGRTRISDGLLDNFVFEMKHVLYQHLSTQLLDTIDFSDITDRIGVLVTPSTTQISGPLQQAIDDFNLLHIIIDWLPGD
jgi:RHS repeat-associated protein